MIMFVPTGSRPETKELSKITLHFDEEWIAVCKEEEGVAAGCGD